MPRKYTKKDLIEVATQPIEVQEKIVEIVKEVIKYVPQTVEVEKPRLEGFELYAKLRDINYPQGGLGVSMENPANIDKAYVPTAQEVISFFAGNPEQWDALRDGIIRTYIEIYENNI